MPIRPDLDYYQRRERQERALADRANNDAGRHIHLEMAKRYAALIAESPQEGEPQPVMRVGAWG